MELPGEVTLVERLVWHKLRYFDALEDVLTGAGDGSTQLGESVGRVVPGKPGNIVRAALEAQDGVHDPERHARGLPVLVEDGGRDAGVQDVAILEARGVTDEVDGTRRPHGRRRM